MLSAFKVLFCSFLLLIISSTMAKDQMNHHIQFSEAINENNRQILKLKSRIQAVSSSKSEKKQLQKMKDNLSLENFKNRLNQKNEQIQARHDHAKKHEKIKLRYAPDGICKNPCSLDLEAVVSKKSKAQISKYIFYVDDKTIESSSPNLKTVIFFAKSMLTDKQKKLLTKSIPLHRVFKLKVEGIISETEMLESEVKKVIIKSLPSNLTSIELVTKNVLPFNKIQITTAGIGSTKLQGMINNIPLSFEVDPSLGSSQVLYAIMPFFPAGSYKLNISNFTMDIQVNQAPTVSNPAEYINNLSNNAINLGSAITDGERFKNIISTDGITLFSKFNEVIVAFDNYIKNEASPLEIQKIADIINSIALGDKEAYFFVKNDRNTIREYINISSNKKLISKILSAFIADSYAQEVPQNLLKDIFDSKIKEAVKLSLTLSFNTIIDGMINKCYISKGRSVPISVTNSEDVLVRLFSLSAFLVVSNQAAGGIAYYSGITAAQALVVSIGLDCEGDSTITPNLVIQTQPILPIIPGESFQYNVKCDVGDPRYYQPGSILTRVSSKFDYRSFELNQTSDLISVNKLVNGCSGLGIDVIDDEHEISCTTNLLKDTQFYQSNTSQYEIYNSTSCLGNIDSYDVGTYLVSSPEISCDFVNQESNVNISGKSTKANQLVFDLSKTWKCYKVSISNTINNLKVDFTANVTGGNPGDILNSSAFTYSWDFGDGQQWRSNIPTVSHIYRQAGTYSVGMIVSSGSVEIGRTRKLITITAAEISFLLNINPNGTYLFVDSSPENPIGADLAAPATELNLQTFYNDPAIQLRPGDKIVLRLLGTYNPAPEIGETVNYTAAVFVDNSNNFLSPGPGGNQFPTITPPSCPRNLPTDISQDFGLRSNQDVFVTIPQGATKILFTPIQCYFRVIEDSNNDYSALIKITIVRGEQN